MDAEGQSIKYNTICLATVTMLLIAMLFMQVIYYLRQTAKLDLLKYDIDTCTAGDYTVEYDITKEMYEDFLMNQWPQGQNMTD